MKLTKHTKGYRSMVGSHLFYYGHDENRAQTAAAYVAGRWTELTAAGYKQWPEGELHDVMIAKDAIVKGGVAPVPATPAPLLASTPAPVSGTGTLHTVIDAYVKHQQARTAAGQISLAGVREIRYRCARCKRFLPDVPMSSVDGNALLGFVGIFAKRPTSKTGHVMSADRVGSLIGELRRALDHADATGTWVAPRRWEKLLRVNVAKLRTPTERRAAAAVQTFTIEQLTTIYRAVSPRLRDFIVYSLNTGAANSELATLRVWECKDLNGTNPRIVRERPKTGVKSTHVLWPETVAILKKLVEGKSDDDLVFVAANGKPLIVLDDMARHDLVAQQWRRVLAYHKIVPFLPFRFLRKTGAQMIRDIADLQASEAYLAHAESGVHTFYTKESSIAPAIMEMRKRLQPMFDPPNNTPAITPVDASSARAA